MYDINKQTEKQQKQNSLKRLFISLKNNKSPREAIRPFVRACVHASAYAQEKKKKGGGRGCQRIDTIHTQSNSQYVCL